jgi:hypothetical protein
VNAPEVFLRVSGGDVDIARSDGTGTGGGGDTVGEDLVADLLEVGVGEDETDVAYMLSMPRSAVAGEGRRTPDVGHQTLVLGRVGDETLQSTADHGVLAHEDNTVGAERLADLVHLLRRDIVDGNDEDALELLEESLELLEVSGLEFSCAPHCVL